MAESADRITHVINEEGVNGSVIIPDDAFAVIACISALEVNGVHSLSGDVTADKISKISFRNLSGVKIEIKNDKVKVYLALVINFGENIPAVVAEVQEKVKSAIESMTGFTVYKVHIKVSGINVG